jgi:hypothetical protein
LIEKLRQVSKSGESKEAQDKAKSSLRTQIARYDRAIREFEELDLSRLVDTALELTKRIEKQKVEAFDLLERSYRQNNSKALRDDARAIIDRMMVEIEELKKVAR